jgi:prepilin-type N-terminal cleavage/methylation domain-containing protein
MQNRRKQASVLRGSAVGVTLMEIMVAMAIFSVVIGVTATALTSFYVTMDLQEQRIEAVQSCRAVLGAIREKRHQYKQPEDQFDWTAFLGWIDQENSAGWPEFLKQGASHEELRDHSLAVTPLNLEGNPANPNDAPIEFHVTAAWKDRKGRTMQAQVVSVLTDR